LSALPDDARVTWKKALLLVNVLALVIIVAGPCANGLRRLDQYISVPDSDASVLEGLAGFSVSVHLDYSRNYTNQEAVAYKAALENRLRDKGIKVLPAGEAPCLSVIVTAREGACTEDALAAGNVLAYSTRVVVHERVRLPGRAAYWPVLTWNRENVGVLPATTTCAELCATAAPCIERFLTDYAYARARRAPR
jgi:hypothetical protein